MQATVKWIGAAVGSDSNADQQMAFVAETGSGHMLTMDGAPEGGGRNLGPRPMETVLAGTGACTAYDVVLILRKSGQHVDACEARLEAKRAETDPKVFTEIRFHFLVRGRGLKPNLVERAIKLSHEKYCSASAMLEKTAELKFSWEIINTGV
jgi:putative redox protein